MLPRSLSHPEVESAEARSRLDKATKLVRETRELWVLRVYPDAAEAVGVWRWVGRQIAPEKGEVSDSARAQSEGDRRARGKLRRYVAANRLNRLVSLTYRGEGLHDPHELRRDVSKFARRLRSARASGPLPYAWVPEWHKTGHGLHVHVGLGEYFPKSDIEDSWGHGFVDVRLIRSRGAVGPLAESRVAAGYLAKYLGKDFDRRREAGLHRYEVAQGFQPRSFEIAARTFAEVFDEAREAMAGLAVDSVWRSESAPDWAGPPAACITWRERR